jgi:hypothetical protein
MIGYIYKIHCNKTGEDYYGSTNDIKHRIGIHMCSTEKQLSKRQCTSRQIIDRNDWTFSVVEEVKYEDKTELKIRERYYFENFDCINKIVPYATIEEINQRKIERGKTEKGKAEKKAYYEANKEHLKRKSREHYTANKEAATARKAERIQCGCGMEHARTHLARHKKSKRHTDWEKSQENA